MASLFPLSPKISVIILNKSVAKGIRYGGAHLSAALRKYKPAALPLPAKIPPDSRKYLHIKYKKVIIFYCNSLIYLLQ